MTSETSNYYHWRFIIHSFIFSCMLQLWVSVGLEPVQAVDGYTLDEWPAHDRASWKTDWPTNPRRFGVGRKWMWHSFFPSSSLQSADPRALVLSVDSKDTCKAKHVFGEQILLILCSRFLNSWEIEDNVCHLPYSVSPSSARLWLCKNIQLISILNMNCCLECRRISKSF